MENHNDRITRLLKKDADRRKYLREYMKEYRLKKKAETGKSQIQYAKIDDVKRLTSEYYKRKTVLSDLKNLFRE